MNKLKIALIGLGSMGRNHLKTIRNTPEVELVATVDPVNNNLDELSNIQQYDNIEDLIKNHTLDAAIIATPTSTHFEVAERLLNEKIKLQIVFCIKKDN